MKELSGEWKSNTILQFVIHFLHFEQKTKPILHFYNTLLACYGRSKTIVQFMIHFLHVMLKSKPILHFYDSILAFYAKSNQILHLI